MKPAMVAAMLLLIATGSQPQTSQQPVKEKRRIALLVGNRDYSKIAPLPAVRQEMALIKAALDRARFSVTEVNDFTLGDVQKQMEDFTAKVQPGDICVFYYSGYAVQDGVDDFLVPVDFDPSRRATLQYVAYPLTLLVQSLGARNAWLKMFFLEGRPVNANIPDMRPGLRIPETGALEVLFGIPAATDQPYSAPPGQVGFFTQALAAVIDDEEGVPVTEVMSNVLRRVMDKTNKQQQPANLAKLTHDFFFHAKKVEPPPPPAPLFAQNSKDFEEYRLIPAGSFLMGCVPDDDRCDKSEKPQHGVTISKPFWLGRNEVRAVSYQRYFRDDPKHRKMPPKVDWNPAWREESRPISNMHWEDAKAYCEWAGGRLPTEAEWEYAARVGKENQVYPFDLAEARNRANFDGQQGGVDIWGMAAAPVRSFRQNEWGLFDMAGNVWEFVNDWYADDYYASSPAIDPRGPVSGKQHVRRGGSYYSDARKHLRLSLRLPGDQGNNNGFRCAMDDTPESRRNLQFQ